MRRITIVLLVAAALLAGAAVGAVTTARFSDTDGHWAENAIEWAAEHKLVAGRADGTFDPDRPVSRAQLVTILWRYHRQFGVADGFTSRVEDSAGGSADVDRDEVDLDEVVDELEEEAVAGDPDDDEDEENMPTSSTSTTQAESNGLPTGDSWFMGGTAIIISFSRGADTVTVDSTDGPLTLPYDNNDQFSINRAAVTISEFEAALTVGDELHYVLQASPPESVSEFDLGEA